MTIVSVVCMAIYYFVVSRNKNIFLNDARTIRRSPCKPRLHAGRACCKNFICPPYRPSKSFTLDRRYYLPFDDLNNEVISGLESFWPVSPAFIVHGRHEIGTCFLSSSIQWSYRSCNTSTMSPMVVVVIISLYEKQKLHCCLLHDGRCSHGAQCISVTQTRSATRIFLQE